MNKLYKHLKKVSVIGVGKTNYGVFKEKTLLDLAVEAGKEAMDDAGITPHEVSAFYLGNYAGSDFVNQNHLAPYVGAIHLRALLQRWLDVTCINMVRQGNTWRQ